MLRPGKATAVLLTLFLLAFSHLPAPAGQQGPNLLLADPAAQPKPPRVLFVGNSYTIANSMPAMFRDLAASQGRWLNVGASVAGGASLSQHADPRTAAGARTLGMLAWGWDWVVLQDQSLIPTIQVLRRDLSLPGLKALVGRLPSSTGVVLFLTWGRENGYQLGSEPDLEAEADPLWATVKVGSFDCMAYALHRAYGWLAARSSHALTSLAPVGLAWQSAVLAQRGGEPRIEGCRAAIDAEYGNTIAYSVPWAGYTPAAPPDFWTADGSHPTPAGSYLASAVIYARMFGVEPRYAGYDAGLGEEEAARLLGLAWRVVSGP